MKRFAVISIFLLVLAPHAYGHGPDPDVHSFNWAVVDGGSESMSSMQEMDEVTRLERRIGNTFLYIHQDSERYVIRDRALMDRAERALQPLRDAKGVIGDWKLQGEPARLDRKIEKQSARNGRAKTKRDADESLDRALKNVKREMRAILEEAKSRHLAERVE